ncbi:MAG: dephospho-CoA kinase [Candidatus Electrothrix sp. GW3-4]|uniref:dephospho-CoA kinase n=1 Tax=Candidatus Electrothrix sp. GW3-4 TaxID=3126740 RepID=UPI0030D09B84
MGPKRPARQRQNEGGQRVIGITGGIGSGKSRVCSFLAEKYNLPLINLDRVCRDLLQPQEAGWQALRVLLPSVYFSKNEELDRQRLRQRLFTDSVLRSQVDRILHPLACQEMKKQLSSFSGPVLAEIPLLFEAGWQESVDLILVVYADTAVRLQRIMQRDQVSKEQAQQAIAAQQSLREKAAAANHVLDNSGPWEHTCSQVQNLLSSGAFWGP